MLALERAPADPDELHLAIRAVWGVNLPRVKVCPDHVAPFDAVAHAYFTQPPNHAIWYASRGSGKSLALATLGLTVAFLRDIDVNILGGSSWQSQNVRKHMAKLLQAPGAPRYAVKRDLVSVIETASGHLITPLPASQTSVRGPHPPLTLLDEIDEMDLEIYAAAMGQAMETLNERGELVEEYIVSSSTWQNPAGTMSAVLDEAKEKNIPIFSWCWKELLTTHGGWMSPEFIARKRTQVTATMWRVEYELGEPAGDSRAFDPDKVEQYFVHYLEPRGGTPAHYAVDAPLYPGFLERQADMPDVDELWVFEAPDPLGLYAAGADWAKERDKTVLVVIRYDCHPRRLVYCRRMGRLPYPVMSGRFGELVRAYDAVARHDKTGVGNAVNDYLVPEAQHGFDFTDRRKRTQMLIDYIADVEHGGYRLPREIAPLWTGHRRATTGDVYAPSTATTHLPDEVAAMALAHRAAGNVPRGELEIPDLSSAGVPVRRVDAPFQAQPAVTAGTGELVTTLEERTVREPVGAVSRRRDFGDELFPTAPRSAGEDDWWWR